MGLSIIDELCKLLAYCINCMETRQSHVAIQISGSWTRVYAENLNRYVVLLKLHCHHTHHGILGSLACHVSQRMLIRTDFTRNGDVDDSTLVGFNERKKGLSHGQGAKVVYVSSLLDILHVCLPAGLRHVTRNTGIVH